MGDLELCSESLPGSQGGLPEGGDPEAGWIRKSFPGRMNDMGDSLRGPGSVDDVAGKRKVELGQAGLVSGGNLGDHSEL